ncbi:DSD1 family PLP-dependent enzyme [Pelagibius sp. CAU 1746]|uniref:DSD1 family PLP-dependent enzyme n=1 Tax=Pelagibius sp. CAU 1746 TaxID=3140370 RepID=UPI00325B086C
MTTCPAARIGDRWEDIDTPALVVELDILEENLRRMAAFAKDKGIRLRPHAKSHKCPAIARKQVELGAVGVCCQKVTEAESLAEGGITDILITNQIVGERKLNRLVALARRIKVAVCADHSDNLRELDAAARNFDTTLSVLVEIDVGSHRCGVQPGEPAVALAREIAAAKNLRFGGIQAYHGRAQHQRTYEERQQTIEAASALVEQTCALLAAEGLECDIIGGAGTGTYPFETASGVYNELQVGSYVFLDRDYSLNLDAEGRQADDFTQSLFIKSTVLSTPEPDRAVTDAGLKAYTTDAGLPGVHAMPGAEVLAAADEHCNIRFHGPHQRPQLGETVMLIPGHCDPAVNLHDWIIGLRNGRVESIWPVAARGAVL